MMKSDISLKRSGARVVEFLRREWLFSAIIVVAALLRVYRIDERCLFGDGVLTLGIIAEPDAAGVWTAVSDGFQADLPLYYLLLHYWSRFFGDSLFWLRGFSAIAGVAGVLVSYRLVKTLFNRRAALLVAFLLAISPFRILLNQTVRYYTLNSLVNLLALFLFIRFWRDAGAWRKSASYVVCRAVSLYINYSSFLFLFSEALFVFFQRRNRPEAVKKWLPCLVAVIALWLPISFFFFRDFGLLVSGEGFSRTPLKIWGAANIPYFLFAFSVGKTVSPFNFPLLGLIALVFGYLVWMFWRRARPGLPRESVAFAMIVLCVPLITAALSNYNSPRYVMASSVMYISLIALGILALPRRAAVLCLLFIVLVRGYSLYNLYMERNYVKMEFIDDWDKIASFVNARVSPGDLVVYNQLAFAFYMNRINPAAPLAGLPENDESMAEFIAQSLEGRRLPAIVVVDSPLSGNKMAAFEYELRALERWLTEHGYRLVQAKGFDRDYFAGEKRRYVNRPFPDYRTRVCVYRLQPS